MRLIIDSGYISAGSAMPRFDAMGKSLSGICRQGIEYRDYSGENL